MTEFTARIYKAPRHVIKTSLQVDVADSTGLQGLIEVLLATAHGFVSATSQWGSMGLSVHRKVAGQGFSASLGAAGWELSQEDANVLFKPAMDYIRLHPSQYSGKIDGTVWNASSWSPSQGFQNLPWVEVHADREISTMLIRSPCRLVPDSTDAASASHTAKALTILAQEVPELSYSQNETEQVIEKHVISTLSSRSFT